MIATDDQKFRFSIQKVCRISTIKQFHDWCLHRDMQRLVCSLTSLPSTTQRSMVDLLGRTTQLCQFYWFLLHVKSFTRAYAVLYCTVQGKIDERAPTSHHVTFLPQQPRPEVIIPQVLLISPQKKRRIFSIPHGDSRVVGTPVICNYFAPLSSL